MSPVIVFLHNNLTTLFQAPQAKNISIPAMHSGIVQHVSNANTSGNVDVES